MVERSTNVDNCPNCKISFIGEAIPKDIAQYYSGSHWRREIGIDGGLIGIYDGTVAYKCPDCGHEFPRDNSKWALEIFNKYKNIKGEK